MKVKYIHAVIIILGLCIVSEVDAGKILGGIKHVYQEAKCGLHKLGDKIYHHEHSMDPCEDHSSNLGVTESADSGSKSSEETMTTSAQISASTSTDYPKIDIRAGNIPENKDSPIQGRRLNVGANCPDGYRADINGVCRLEY